jgi:hypothetical protein
MTFSMRLNSGNSHADRYTKIFFEDIRDSIPIIMLLLEKQLNDRLNESVTPLYSQNIETIEIERTIYLLEKLETGNLTKEIAYELYCKINSLFSTRYRARRLGDRLFAINWSRLSSQPDGGVTVGGGGSW